MRNATDTPHAPTLEIIATMRDGAIQASIHELRQQDRLTMALRSALNAGVPIDELSAESGLSVEDIRRRIRRELALGEDLETLTGAA